MQTAQDYYLKPQEGPTSEVCCRHCDSEIGVVYTARQTPTGRSTGRSEEEIDTEARDLARDHLGKCDDAPAANPGSFENQRPNRPPQKGPMENRR